MLTKALPKDMKSNLPTIQEIEQELAVAVRQRAAPEQFLDGLAADEIVDRAVGEDGAAHLGVAPVEERLDRCVKADLTPVD